MRIFRSVLFWMHLSAGVLAGVVILIMSVTGVLLTYQRQMQWWADTRHYRAAPPAGAEALPTAAIVDAVVARYPEAAVTAVTRRADVEAPVAVALGNRTVFVNPYTAVVYGEGTGAGLRGFFSQVVAWHRYVAMTGDYRPTGRAITGAANLVFLFIVLSGLYLWWPRGLGRSRVRQIIWFRGGLSPKARDFNWHHVMGFWSAVPLALVVFSAVVISYPRASDLVYRLAGEAPPPRAEARGRGDNGHPAALTVRNLDGYFAAAAVHTPDWTILGLRLPSADDPTVTVTVDRGNGGQPQLRGTLTLDAASSAVRRWDGFDTQGPGRRARSFLRFAHTGEYFGLPGQTVAGLVSAAGAVLVYTGLALSWRRFRSWRQRRLTADAESARLAA